MTQALAINELERARERLGVVRREVSQVYRGPSEPIEQLLVALLARGHALLEGVPGVAKTTLVKSFATALGCSIRRVQFTPDLLPADITGTHVLSPKDGDFRLHAGPIFAHLVLADEINRAPAKTQSALLEAMQEQQVTIEGTRFELPNPFFVLATQNPVDLEGTYPLPEAQIDRFLLRIEMGYPAEHDEIAMLREHDVETPATTPILSPDEVLELQSIAGRVHIEDDLLEYAVRIAAFTRSHPRVVLGVSPRASLGLVRAAKARAVLGARSYASPDDVRASAQCVLAHRLIVSPEFEGDEQMRRGIISEALDKVSYRKSVRPV